MKLLLVDNYDSFTFNLRQLLRSAGAEVEVVVNDRLLELDMGKYHRMVISPGPGIAQEAGQLMPFLAAYSSTVPALGICLGYEALAENEGARLLQLPEPLHGIRNTATRLMDHPLFTDIPDPFPIGHYHSWIADPATFGDNIMELAHDEQGINVAIAHRKHPWTGLLFHPESIMTDHGYLFIRNWLALRY